MCKALSISTLEACCQFLCYDESYGILFLFFFLVVYEPPENERIEVTGKFFL